MIITALVLLILFVGGCFIFSSDPEKSIQDFQNVCTNIGKEIWRDEEVIGICHGDYVGGIKNMSATLQENKVIYYLGSGLGVGSQSKAKKIIKYDNIEDMYIDSTRSIEEQISKGKLLCFGLLALGMKKDKKQVIQEIIVLKVKDDDGEYNVFVQAYSPEGTQELYNDIKNKITLKQFLKKY